MNHVNLSPGLEIENEPETVFLLDLEDEPDTEPGINIELLAEEVEIGRHVNRSRNQEAL